MKVARSLGVLLTGAALATLLGCPLRSKSDDGPVDAGTISVSGTGAKNEAQITRYPNETSLGGAPALIANNGTVARTFPGAGVQVAILPKATPCGKIAQYGNAGTLVMWNDPADGLPMMGWVPNTAFQSGVAPSNIKPVTIPKDSGAPAVQDAGGGNTPTPPAVQDAGQPATDPCPVSCAPGPNNQCPSNRKLDNGMCRPPCKADKDCPRGQKCNTGRGVCTSG